MAGVPLTVAALGAQCNGSAAQSPVSIVGVVSAKSTELPGRVYLLEICGGDGEGLQETSDTQSDWIRTAVLVKERALVNGRGGVQVLQKVLFSNLERKTLTVPGSDVQRWVFVTSEFSSLLQLTEEQYGELVEQCRERHTPSSPPERDSEDGAGTAGVAVAGRGQEDTTLRGTETAHTHKRDIKTVMYSGIVLEDIGDGLFVAEWLDTNTVLHSDSEEDYLDIDRDTDGSEPWKESVTSAVLVVEPHLEALVPSIRLCEGAHLRIANAHVLELPASLHAITLGGYCYSKVLSVCGYSDVTVMHARGEEERQSQQLFIHRLAKYHLFHFLWAVKQIQSLSVYHTTLPPQDWWACAAAALECMGVEPMATPHRLLEFLNHGNSCSVAESAHQLPLAFNLLHCSMLSGNLARIVGEAFGDLPYGLTQYEFSQQELKNEGLLVGRLRANAFGELLLEDDLGSIRAIADDPGSLRSEALGNLVVARRYDLVVESLPRFELEGESNPYVAESAREKEEKKRRTLEKKLRYVRLEMTSAVAVGENGCPSEGTMRMLQALLEPAEDRVAKKSGRKARTIFLVTQISAMDVTAKGRARFYVRGCPISDSVSPVHTYSETLVTFTTTCIPCFKGKRCQKLHSTAFHGLLLPGRCYSIPCHRADDGTYLANYCDKLGIPRVSFSGPGRVGRVPTNATYTLEFRTIEAFDAFQHCCRTVAQCIPDSSSSVTDACLPAEDRATQGKRLDEDRISLCAVLYAKQLKRDRQKWTLMLKCLVRVPANRDTLASQLCASVGSTAELWVFMQAPYAAQPAHPCPMKEQADLLRLPLGLLPGASVTFFNVKARVQEGKKTYLACDKLSHFVVRSVGRHLASWENSACPRDLLFMSRLHLLQPFPSPFRIFGDVTEVERANFSMGCTECECDDCYHRGATRTPHVVLFVNMDDGTGECAVSFEGELAMRLLADVGIEREFLVKLMLTTNRPTVYQRSKISVQDYEETGRNSLEKRQPHSWQGWCQICETLSNITLATNELEVVGTLRRVRQNPHGQLQFTVRSHHFCDVDHAAAGLAFASLLDAPMKR